MSVKTLGVYSAAFIGFLSLPAAALADPLFPTFVLAPVSATEFSEIETADTPEAPPILDSALSIAFLETDDLDIAEDPIADRSYGASDGWERAPTARRSIAELRESFETGDVPQFTLTRFVTD